MNNKTEYYKKIITSLRDQDIKNLNKIQEDLGLSNASETIRFVLKRAADSTLSKGNQIDTGGFLDRTKH